MSTNKPKPKERRPTGAGASHIKFRTRWRHVLLIDEEIRSDKAPNCRKLAEHLEVSQRTILRDIDFLRYDLSAPVEYDPGRGGYVYTEPNWVMPSVRITEGELFALMLADQALQAYAGTPWAQTLQKAFDRMTASLPDRVEVAPRELLGRVEFHPEGQAIIEPGVLETIAAAVKANQALRLTHTPLWEGKPRERLVDPYMLRQARGAWYLIGRDHSSGQVPMFHLSRVSQVEPTGQTFDYAASGFDPKTYFGDTFGTFQTNQRHRVVIEFRGVAAQLVRERAWAQSQVLKDLPGGRLRFEVEVAHLDDIWPWVLSWGPNAKVLAPPELAARIALESGQTASLYQKQRPGKGA